MCIWVIKRLPDYSRALILQFGIQRKYLEEQGSMRKTFLFQLREKEKEKKITFLVVWFRFQLRKPW